MASSAARRSGRAVRSSDCERRSTSLEPTAFSPGQAICLDRFAATHIESA
jgi:hypothetical protein